MKVRIPPRAGLSGRVIGKDIRSMARSRFQEGSLFVRGKRNKMYVARYYEKVIGSDGRPRRMRRSIVLGPVAEIGSRRAALNRLAELLRPINLGRQKPRMILSFEDFVTEQWKLKVLSLFKLSSQVGYRPLLSKHLLPYFGDYVLSEILPMQIQGFLSEKAKTVLSWHTVRNLRNLLRSILRTAVEWGYLEENPTNKVKPRIACAVFTDSPSSFSSVACVWRNVCQARSPDRLRSRRDFSAPSRGCRIPKSPGGSQLSTRDG